MEWEIYFKEIQLHDDVSSSRLHQSKIQSLRYSELLAVARDVSQYLHRLTPKCFEYFQTDSASQLESLHCLYCSCCPVVVVDTIVASAYLLNPKQNNTCEMFREKFMFFFQGPLCPTNHSSIGRVLARMTHFKS